ncbi:MAG: acetoacetate--CoA ligase [Desulfobacteraceae bacterium]|nr:acetoacetate--CoA ligase [Desulfobacteraceae bacterium]
MARLLWQPSKERIESSNLRRFMQTIQQWSGIQFSSYGPLYQWSIDHIPEFWDAMWKFAAIKASQPYTQVVDNPARLPGACWFSGARLNFAENLLRHRDQKTALIFRGEDRVVLKVSYAQLYDEVARLARALKTAGIQAGDRVAGFMPNLPHTVIAMLAAASMGAVWSSCSPDFGIKGVLDRFGQIKPTILFAANGYWFKGQRVDCLGRIAEIRKALPDLRQVVVVPYTDPKPALDTIPNAVLWDNFRAKEDNLFIEFAQLPFEHPLYIMFTSGTTGLPKCMVQSAGGILINHMKELLLHADLKRGDTIFYFTTCGWMMWNWLISSLAVGATVVLYDGNPFHPGPDALWKMAQEEKISIFGTSAGYIAALQNSGLKPKEVCELVALRTILSTGSPLSVEGFEFVYDHIKSDLQLASISGGSDINGCFAGGNPIGPVYAGELQCRGLGMKVLAYDENGQPVTNQQGELVCAAASPSMPIYFWDDPDGKKYKSAYFDHFPNVWRHGDFIEINDHGGVVIYGRSDATLNPGGVRIGTAEIYRQMESLPEIADSLVIGQNWKGDVRVVLFVKTAPGVELNDALKQKIKTLLRTNASPRHVPAKIIAVPAIPYTLNMKKVELAVKKIIEGQPVLNKDALSNPEVLEYFAGLKELELD